MNFYDHNLSAQIHRILAQETTILFHIFCIAVDKFETLVIFFFGIGIKFFRVIDMQIVHDVIRIGSILVFFV